MIVILTNERWGQDFRPSYNQTSRQTDKGSTWIPFSTQKWQQDKSYKSCALAAYQKRKRADKIIKKDSQLK